MYNRGMKRSETRTNKTAIKKAAFLRALVKHPNNIGLAADAAGQSRTYMYALAEKDPEFAQAWEDIDSRAVDAADEELYRRAVQGVDKPVFQGKELVGHIREFSDTLLIFFLKGRKPNVYNPVQKVAPTTPDGAPACWAGKDRDGNDNAGAVIFGMVGNS